MVVKKAKKKTISKLRTSSPLESMLWMQILAEKLPRPVQEFKFHPTRLWRFDFCYKKELIGIECEGGIFNRGRHTSGKGFTADAEKYNTATIMGYRVLRFTMSQIRSGQAIAMIKEILSQY